MINEFDFLNELNEFMKEEEAKQLNIQQDENNNYLINDRAQANYFINLSKQCDNDIESLKEFVAQERERYLNNLQKFEEQQIESINKKKEYYNRALEDFMRRELDATGKKTLKLPNGTLSIKKQQPHYNYVSEEEMLLWMETNHPELVKITRPEPKISVDKKELKKRAIIDNGALILDGSEVPGVNISEVDDVFSLK